MPNVFAQNTGGGTTVGKGRKLYLLDVDIYMLYNRGNISIDESSESIYMSISNLINNGTFLFFYTQHMAT